MYEADLKDAFLLFSMVNSIACLSQTLTDVKLFLFTFVALCNQSISRYLHIATWQDFGLDLTAYTITL